MFRYLHDCSDCFRLASSAASQQPVAEAADLRDLRRRFAHSRASSIERIPISDLRLPATIATMTETIRIIQPLRSRAFAAASRCRSAATSVSNQSRNAVILGKARVVFGHTIQ